MYRIRLFEERAKRMYKQHLLDGNFLGALHSYIGEEAIAVGVCACLRKDDYVFSTHRGHGHFIAKGGDVKRMLAELQGKATGCSRGRGGSMHLFDPEIGFLGGNGIVGGGIPLALGSAYSAWYRGSDQVTVCFFGDGAASQGTFHEALNLAGLWKLPVVFVCENNCYAVTTGVGETISIANVADRAAGYGLPGKVVDGNDLLAVHEAANAAVARARSGDGASLLECKTYRVDPHCMVLPETRATDELAGWKQKDPIARFEKWLEGQGAGTPADFARVRDEASRDVDEAERFAAQSPYPDVAEFLRECALG
ncbi:MAG: thiamine pyrophosphate-dependent dehydrogenase E1 component subunit alpha [Planctomycetes bacterium]|nr:thiamine pyrophosphate-dependent dehydrogenase E1 component subunit alpha [Planctomycetota bacterium]